MINGLLNNITASNLYRNQDSLICDSSSAVYKNCVYIYICLMNVSFGQKKLWMTSE